jgi:putative lipoprotein
MLLLLASCGTPPLPERHFVFDCGEDEFSVTFRGDTALVAIRDTIFALPQAVSASGARFTDGTSTFWEHQGTADFELPGLTYQSCPRTGP